VSRIGRLPVEIPAGVQVTIAGSDVQVQGPKGQLKRSFSPSIVIKMEENNQVVVQRFMVQPGL
jgi:large subunit ribosomal protein L6